MERIVLFLVLGAFLTGSLYMLTVQSNALDADQALSTYQYQELAREAALTGLNNTVRKLANDSHGPWSTASTYRQTSTPFGSGGSYEVDVRAVGATGDTVDVYVTGIFGPDTMRIDARYKRAMDTEGIPPAFRSVILTDSLIQMSGNITITTLDSDFNANIHTNGEIQTNGNAFLVEGYGTYSDPNGGVTNQPDNFVPKVDFNGDESNVVQIPEISIPDATMPFPPQPSEIHHISLIEYEYNGSSTVPLNVDGLLYGTSSTTGWCYDGTIAASHCFENGQEVLGKTKAFVWATTGSVKLKNVQIDGNVVLYGQAGIVIKDDVIGGLTSPGQETMLMLRTPGAVDIYGNDQIRASIWANGQVTFHGTPDLTGNILSPYAQFASFGNFTLTYAAPSSIITKPGYSNIDPVGPVLISYAEWDDVALP